MSTFGQRTTILRKRLGLTQKEFADAGKMSQSNLSLIENDGVFPNLQFILTICETLANAHINLNWWICGEGALFLTEEARIGKFKNIDPDLKDFLRDLKQSVDEVTMRKNIILRKKD